MGRRDVRSIYIASPERGSGKSVVALGLVDLLTRRVQRVGVFRPVTRTTAVEDELIGLVVQHDGVQLPADACVGVGYEDVHRNPEAALATIVDRYRTLRDSCDVVVIVGSDYVDVAGPTELSFNARVATNLGAPVLLVVNGHGRSADELAQLADIATTELRQGHANVVGVVANRSDSAQVEAVGARLAGPAVSMWCLPEIPLLAAPVVADIAASLDAELLHGDASLLQREAEHMLVAGMGIESLLGHLRDGQLCITTGDRPSALITLTAAHAARGFPNLAGIILDGGFRPVGQVAELIAGLDGNLPILATEHDTYETARMVASTAGSLARGSQRKIDAALAAFDRHLSADSVLALLDVPPSEVVTPLMFESMVLERAQADPRRIVLAEGLDERILRAASTLLSRGAVEITLLGDPARIMAKANGLGLEIEAATIIDPTTSELVESFAAAYTDIRAHRGMTIEPARDIVRDVSYFATMMVKTGLADGMVSGAAHSTAHTVTPAFEIIKTAPGADVASSVFFMCLEDRVLVYGDCAIIPVPTVEELADIAISASETAAAFGIEPRIAMLSYSTGSSGSGADVERVRSATELVRRRRPDLLVDGPLQYDAAVDASVASTKLPDSEVAGRATVFVFPDLNTGNNTYKAVQRSAGAVAIGPILQGLAKPVNDLSRGATVRDIVNTIAITAVQAGSQARAAGSGDASGAGSADSGSVGAGSMGAADTEGKP